MGGTDAIQRGLSLGVVISGRVKDGAGRPLGGVRVKMFSNGVMIASDASDDDGSFSVDANPPVEDTSTTVLWFESPDPGRLLDASLLVHGGVVALEQNLFPPCTDRVELIGGNAQIEVAMLTADERKEVLERSRCLEAGSAP
jgi:hypothetical protein